MRVRLHLGAALAIGFATLTFASGWAQEKPKLHNSRSLVSLKTAAQCLPMRFGDLTTRQKRMH
jgi:hypothetical protein